MGCPKGVAALTEDQKKEFSAFLKDLKDNDSLSPKEAIGMTVEKLRNLGENEEKIKDLDQKMLALLGRNKFDEIPKFIETEYALSLEVKTEPELGEFFANDLKKRAEKYIAETKNEREKVQQTLSQLKELILIEKKELQKQSEENQKFLDDQLKESESCQKAELVEAALARKVVLKEGLTHALSYMDKKGPDFCASLQSRLQDALKSFEDQAILTNDDMEKLEADQKEIIKPLLSWKEEFAEEDINTLVLGLQEAYTIVKDCEEEKIFSCNNFYTTKNQSIHQLFLERQKKIQELDNIIEAYSTKTTELLGSYDSKLVSDEDTLKKYLEVGIDSSEIDSLLNRIDRDKKEWNELLTSLLGPMKADVGNLIVMNKETEKQLENLILLTEDCIQSYQEKLSNLNKNKLIETEELQKQMEENQKQLDDGLKEWESVRRHNIREHLNARDNDD